MKKVIIAMSGGVDSSVAAYLLKMQGYEVEGVTYYMYEQEVNNNMTTCSSLKSVKEVSDIADCFGIKHEIIDIRKEFSKMVIEPFINAYQKGKTPNPCIICNRFIKFPMLLEKAKERNASYISTGHYAIVEKVEKSNRAILRKGIDPKKDQSYFLYALNQDILKKLILPLGSMTKDKVRKLAHEIGLPSLERQESQEICFIQGRNYKSFIQSHLSFASRHGNIMHVNGGIIGKHKGIYNYTIGQRKGMGIAFTEPLYIVKIDPINNIIIAGPREYAKKREFLVSEINWIEQPSIKKNDLIKASVKIRSTMKEQPATIYFYNNQDENHNETVQPLNSKVLKIVFDEPQWAPAPGQSAVFYVKDIVLGGGIIL
ncbi:MAG: tRNA 2-thiouridine(34) synthase MnmA [Nitrospirae bacterium]|jgi:tRNA-specific 2-thiouridylase|nr:tRNA 2-thiouridine(34) synthase MnmA [Nitrospirota bacterium]